MNVFGKAWDVTYIGRPSIQELVMVAIFGWCEGFDYLYWFIPEHWFQYILDARKNAFLNQGK